MPQYYRRSGWSEAGQAAHSLGSELQNIAVGLAHQKYQQDYQHQTLLLHALENQQLNKHRAEQTRLLEQHYAAQNAELASQAALHKQQAGNLKEQSDSGLVLGDIMQHIATNPNMSPEDQALYQGAAVNRGAKIGAQHPANIMEQIAQAISMQDPHMRQLLAAGGESKLYHNVGPNSVGYSGVPGVPPIQGPTTLKPGDVNFGPQFADFGANLEPRIPTAYGLPQVGKPDDRAIREFGHLGQALKTLGPMGPPDATDPNYGPYNQTLSAYTNSPVLNRQKQLTSSPYSSVVEGIGGPQPDPSTGFQVPLPQPMPGVPFQEEQDMGQPPAFDPSAAFQAPQTPQQDPSFYVPQYMGNDSQPGDRMPHPQSQVPPGFKLQGSNAAIKAARANDLERQNPTLPRQVIIDMVNQEFQGK